VPVYVPALRLSWLLFCNNTFSAYSCKRYANVFMCHLLFRSVYYIILKDLCFTCVTYFFRCFLLALIDLRTANGRLVAGNFWLGRSKSAYIFATTNTKPQQSGERHRLPQYFLIKLVKISQVTLVVARCVRILDTLASYAPESLYINKNNKSAKISKVL